MATMQKKFESFIERMGLVWHLDQADVIQRLSIVPRQSIRMNSLKQDFKTTLTQMHSLGWDITDIPWCQEAFYFNGQKKEVTQHELTKEGALYVQNASSFIPVVQLDPQPGELILDMAASPGGKASHIAARTNNQAQLYVNDVDFKRVLIMKKVFDLLGVQPTQMLQVPAQLLHEHVTVQFDKILLDAPCSAEGYIHPGDNDSIAHWNSKRIKQFNKLQKKLITEAYHLLKPGGVLVYATCTYAPEENESVLSYALDTFSDLVAVPLLPINIAQQQPLTEWSGTLFNPGVCHAMRVLPSDNHEGFFVAKLQKAKR